VGKKSAANWFGCSDFDSMAPLPLSIGRLVPELQAAWQGFFLND
jgi:hypothetical protein